MVYIEFVVLNNLIANWIIVSFTSKLLGEKKRTRYFSIALGTIFGVVTPCISLNELATILVKTICAIILVIFVTGKTNVKKFLVALSIFYAISFCLAGATTALIYSVSMTHIKLTTEELTFYILGGGIVFYLTFINLIEWVKAKKTRIERKVQVRLNQGDYMECESFVDTGNEVTYKQKGVIFVPNILKDKLDIYSTNDIIKVKTVTNEKFFSVYILSSIRFVEEEKTIEDVPVVFINGTKNKIILSRSM